MKQRIYVGCKRPGAGGTLAREVFRASVTPSDETHGSIYYAAIGPFRTVRAASFMAKYGQGNPHLQTVQDAERISKQEAMKADQK